jgi:hypothetical protein
MNTRIINTRSMNAKFAKEGSSQLQNFNNTIRDLTAVNNQSVSPTYQDTMRRIQSMLNVSKTINRDMSLVFHEFIKFNINIAMKFMSIMYLKLHEMIIDSKNVHIRYYIVEEKEILNIKKIALQLEKHCRKSLDILFGLMARVDKKNIPNYNLIEMKHTQIKSQYSLRPRKNISYGEEDTFDDPKDADYVFEEVDDEADDEDDDYDDEDDDEEEEHDDDQDDDQDDEEDKQFISDYYNDPDYNPDEEAKYDYSFLNNNVDKNGEIVLKAGIDHDNNNDNDDDNDNIDCDYHDVIHANGYEPEQELIYNYKNNKLVNVCKRRVENGNAIYTQIKM